MLNVIFDLIFTIAVIWMYYLINHILVQRFRNGWSTRFKNWCKYQISFFNIFSIFKIDIAFIDRWIRRHKAQIATKKRAAMNLSLNIVLCHQIFLIFFVWNCYTTCFRWHVVSNTSKQIKIILTLLFTGKHHYGFLLPAQAITSYPKRSFQNWFGNFVTIG